MKKLCLALLLAGALPGIASAFCGFFVAKADTKLFNSSSRVVLARHDGHVFSARFSPDGTQVVTASQDATVCVWAVDGEPLLERVGARLTRELTAEERATYGELLGD